MGQTATQVRHDIERTRADMSSTVDAIEDRVRPGRIVRRRTDRMREGWWGWRDRVMGSAHDSGHRMGDRSHQARERMSGSAEEAREAMRHAPEAMRQRTEGNPWGVGLLAFGGGMLLASLLPESETEHQAARRLAPMMEPVKDEARDVAMHLREEMAEPAKEAAGSVADSAVHAGREMGDEVTRAAKR